MGLTYQLQLTDLGAVLQATIGVVPDGVVVFLPSYAFLDKVRAFWTKSGLLQRLGERKQVSKILNKLKHVLIFYG